MSINLKPYLLILTFLPLFITLDSPLFVYYSTHHGASISPVHLSILVVPLVCFFYLSATVSGIRLGYFLNLLAFLMFFLVSLISAYKYHVSIQFYLFFVFLSLFYFTSISQTNLKIFYFVILVWCSLHLFSSLIYEIYFGFVFDFPIYQAFVYYPSVLFCWFFYFATLFFFNSLEDNSPGWKIFYLSVSVVLLVLMVESGRRSVVLSLFLWFIPFFTLILFKKINSINFILFWLVPVLVAVVVFFALGVVFDFQFLFPESRIFSFDGESFEEGRIGNWIEFFRDCDLECFLSGSDIVPSDDNFHNSVLDGIFRFGVLFFLFFIWCVLLLIYEVCSVFGVSSFGPIFRFWIYCGIFSVFFVPVFVNSGFSQIYFMSNFVLMIITLRSRFVSGFGGRCV